MYPAYPYTPMNKRKFLQSSLILGAAALAAPALLAKTRNQGETTPSPSGTEPGNDEGPFTLAPLPYAYNALEPYIDAQTMQIHHDKHHAAYVSKLNAAVKGTEAAKLSPEELCKNITAYPDAVRNNGGGHYNHTFFWNIMAPKADGAAAAPAGKLTEAINKKFGSLDAFKADFKKAAGDRFGSGWVWLSVNKEKHLFISSTPNQDNPLMPLPGIIPGTPILALDVWEHAYYLKYQNRRPDYADNFWNVVNWPQVEKLYAAAV